MDGMLPHVVFRFHLETEHDRPFSEGLKVEDTPCLHEGLTGMNQRTRLWYREKFICISHDVLGLLPCKHCGLKSKVTTGTFVTH